MMEEEVKKTEKAGEVRSTTIITHEKNI